jgi:phosphohistidine phosphatase
MSRILYLVRHAIAEARQSLQSDKERDLTSKGMENAIQLGNYFKSVNSNIQMIISSPANRALSTAYLVANQISFETNHIIREERIYSGSSVEIIKLLNTLSESVTEILLVGHYPTIVELYNDLTIHESKSTMSTAEMCSLKFDTPWLEITGGTGSLGLAFSPHSI